MKLAANAQARCHQVIFIPIRVTVGQTLFQIKLKICLIVQAFRVPYWEVNNNACTIFRHGERDRLFETTI